jgi:coenzyme F420-reducing hydrogenase alpha subunit
LSTTDELLAWARQTTTPVAALVAGALAECAMLGASDVALLPGAGTDWVARDLGPAIEADDTFEDVPHWHGEPRETGPLGRTTTHPLVESAVTAWGRGVGARVVARLVEMAQTIDALARDMDGRHGSAPAGEGCGIAWVETARGLLVHRVALEAERIASYRIVAPTEWNFHPAGAFARGADGLEGDDPVALERRVRWLVASLDPCVGVRYEATRA